MLTLKKCLEHVEEVDEDTLAELSDEIWELGTLEEIKSKVSPDLFTLHVGINMVGNWQGEGWWGIIRDHPGLMAYIPDVLEAFDLPALKEAFETVLSCFPDGTVFSDDANYCDTINFLVNVRLKVSDERLKAIPAEERKAMVERLSACVDELEGLTEPLWDAFAEEDGWKNVMDFISAHH